MIVGYFNSVGVGFRTLFDGEDVALLCSWLLQPHIRIPRCVFLSCGVQTKTHE